MNIWVFILFLSIGFFLGVFEVFPQKLYAATDYISKGGVILLLSTMGAEIGTNKRILKNIDLIGIQAVLFAIFTIFFSILFTALLTLFLHFENVEPSKKLGEEHEERYVTAIILASLGSGIVIGYFLLPPATFSFLETLSSYALAILLFGIGIDIGWRKEEIKRADFGFKIGLLPLFIGIGSVVGGIVTGVLVNIPLNEAAAVGAGFGWYSLSGILLTELSSIELGLLAFLSNIFREILSIILCPFVAKYLGKIVAIAPGGATTMDVTLPVVKASTGEAYVVPAFISGAILTAFVPFLVPFLVNL